MSSLTSRQIEILETIIRNYIASAEPVGSRTISKSFGQKLSPATVRNEMSELEEAGYISQPHASAGRVPTARGYRFFVDRLLSSCELSSEEERRLAAICEKRCERYRSITEVMREASRLLGELTDCPGLVLSKSPGSPVYKKIGFLKIDESCILVTLVGQAEKIENRMLELGFGVSQEKLDMIARKLNQLGKFTIQEIDRELLEELKTHNRPAVSLEAIEGEDEKVLILESMGKILEQPEFQQPGKLRRLVELLRDKKRMVKILSDLINSKKETDTPAVAIADEVEELAPLNLSLVTSTYTAQGEPVGAVGVIGPSRMRYDRVIKVVKKTAENISEILNR